MSQVTGIEWCHPHVQSVALRVTTATPKRRKMRGTGASNGAAHVGVPVKQLAAPVPLGS
jgi:hypothetical protein